MPVDPGAEIVRTLTEAYRFTAERRASVPSGSTLFPEVVRIMLALMAKRVVSGIIRFGRQSWAQLQPRLRR